MNKSSRLFRLTASGSTQLIKEAPFKREKQLQDLIEKNLHRLLDIDYVANKRQMSDASLQDSEKKIPDTLGITKDLRPAIIEYKKTKKASVTSQIVTYAHYLDSNREKFLSMLHETKGFERIKKNQIIWKPMRLVGIAPSFSSNEPVPAKKNGVELVTYRFFDNHTILLDWQQGKVSSTYIGEEDGSDSSEDSLEKVENRLSLELPPGEMGKALRRCDETMKNLYFNIFQTFVDLGEDIAHDYEPKKYVRFNKAGKALGSIGRPAVKKRFFKVHLKLNPVNERLEEGFTRDMRELGFHGVGYFEITIKNSQDLDRALRFFKKAYKEN